MWFVLLHAGIAAPGLFSGALVREISCVALLLRVPGWNGGHLEKPQLSPRLEMFPLVWCSLSPNVSILCLMTQENKLCFYLMLFI